MDFADKSMVASSRAPLWCLPELSNRRVWCDVEHLGGPRNGHGPDWLARCGFDHVQKLGFELPAILLVSPPGNLVDLTVRGTSVVNGELFSRFASVSAIKRMCFPKVFLFKKNWLFHTMLCDAIIAWKKFNLTFLRWSRPLGRRLSLWMWHPLSRKLGSGYRHGPRRRPWEGASGWSWGRYRGGNGCPERKNRDGAPARLHPGPEATLR